MARKYASIKREITFFIVALLVAVFGCLSFFVLDSQKNSLTAEVKLRGISIARNLSNNLADFLLTGDEMATARLLTDVMNNRGVLYAQVVGSDNRIKAHNNLDAIGEKYAALDLEREIEGYPYRIILAGSPVYGRVMDFSAPVIVKGKLRLGTVHVGLSYGIVEDVLRRAFINVLAIMIVALAVGIIGAFVLGANIARPINDLARGAKIIGSGNLEHRINVKNRNELGALAAVFNMMTKDIKRAQEMMVSQQRLQRELEVAKDIQFSLIPKNIASIEGFEVAAYYLPAKEVSGDYYDIMPLGRDKYGFVVADVSGKGVPAALVMTMARSIIHTESDAESESHVTLQKLNRTIFPDLRNGMFITVFYGILDAASGVLDMSSAGHNDTYVCRNGEVEIHNTGGFPIGADPGPKFDRVIKNKKIQLEKGSVLVAYTDGITEAMDASRNDYGEERLMEVIRQRRENCAADIAQAVIMDVKTFVKEGEQSDDISLLVLKRL